jgi:hypothetical protein
MAGSDDTTVSKFPAIFYFCCSRALSKTVPGNISSNNYFGHFTFEQNYIAFISHLGLPCLF